MHTITAETYEAIRETVERLEEVAAGCYKTCREDKDHAGAERHRHTLMDQTSAFRSLLISMGCEDNDPCFVWLRSKWVEFLQWD